MRYSHLIPFFLLTFLSAISAHGRELQIAIVENVDPYVPEDTLGLSDFLRAEERPFTDLSADFRRGFPDLSGFDLFIVGSFVTTDPTMRATYTSEAGAAELRRFVKDGGIVAVLCQADQDHPHETWMPAPRSLTRVDPNFDRGWPGQPEHPLLTEPETLENDDLAGWRIPSGHTAPRTIWESFNEWTEGAVVLGGGTGLSPEPAYAGIVEMGWGDGRAVFFAMALDRAFAAGNERAVTGATKLLRNLLRYAETVRDGTAPPVRVPGYKHPIRGTVFLDDNGNGRRDEGGRGLAGVAVSDMLDVVLTDENGEFELPNAQRNAIFVFVHQPGDVKQDGQQFFQRLPERGDGTERFDFALEPAENASNEGLRFVQFSDSHVRNVTDRDYMIQATTEIYEMSPPADFVVATGDLVDWGVDTQFQNYVEGYQQPPIPFYNVFGNHELTLSPGIHKYHEYVGPDYYSWEQAGILFLALNPVVPTARQDAWLKNTLEALGRDRPVVAFQHFPPSLADIERFAGMGVRSIFSGHWHSEKEMEYAGVQSVNTPPLIMGGIDASPAGFKLVHMRSDGTADTEWRYGFQEKRLTVVSPSAGAPVSAERFPVIVNAYDTRKDVASVTWRLGTENNPVGGGQLTRESAISWIGEHRHLNASRGSFPLRVEVEDIDGMTWSAGQQVDAILDPPSDPAPGNEWPMFMGDAAHTGNAAPLDGELPLRLVWSVDTGGDPDFASPIYADGRIYMGLKKRTRDRVHGIAAFDPVTGERLWLTETPMAINHTPAFSGGVLAVAEMGGRIYGIDAATGDFLWQQDVIEGDNPARYLYSAPAVLDGWVHAGVTRRVARIRASDGEVAWRRQMGPDTDWISSYGSPAVAGNTIIMTGMFGADAVVARNLDDGERRWGHGAQGGMLASATIAGDVALFCGIHSMLYCVRLSDGEEIWKRGIGEVEEEPTFWSEKMWSATTPAVSMTGEREGIVVAGSGDGRMRGVNLANGEILWTHVSDSSVFKVSPYRRDSRPLLSSPTIAGDKVFFGSADGNLYCLDLETGAELWSYAIGVSIMSTPLVTGNTLYAAAYDGRLYAFTTHE